MIALLALCFWGAFWTYKKGKALWNTVVLCFTTIVIGFSVFAVVIIRSNVMPPTNEYQPDNAFTLVRYLSREQYGTTPLLYGQYYGAPYHLETKKYWAPVNGKTSMWTLLQSLSMSRQERCSSRGCGTATRNMSDSMRLIPAERAG